MKLPKKCYWCKRRFHWLPYHIMWCNALRKQEVSLMVLDIELKEGDILLAKGKMLKDYPQYEKQIRQKLLSIN